MQQHSFGGTLDLGTLLTTAELLRTVEEHTGTKLNISQAQVLGHGAGPLWILAGPGSGKTEVLVLRCLKLALVDGAEPRSILLTTFTEKAARAMQERLITRKAEIERKFPSIGDVDVSDIRIGTLHSIANDVMREYRYRPYQNTQLLDELEQLMFLHKNATIASSGYPKKPPPDDFWVTFAFLLDRTTGFYPGRWKRAKAAVDLFDRIVEDRIDTKSLKTASEMNLRLAVELYEDYAHELEKQGYVDFAHMELHFLNFLSSQQASVFLEGDGTQTRPGISHVLVDEYQDTNPIQEMIYFRLASRTPHNLSVVGDDEEALYRFRGGDVRCILSFEAAAKNYLGVDVAKVFLNTNYRSPKRIVDFYNGLVLSCESTKLLRQFVGKPDIDAVKTHESNYPVLGLIKRDKTTDTATALAHLVKNLRNRGAISDYVDCALLVRSTRERRPNGNLTEAGEYARALRDEDIPIYNPRSRAMLEQPEVQVTLGALLEALDSTDRLNEFSQKQLFQKRIMQDWREAFRKVALGSPLGKYVTAVASAIRSMSTYRTLDIELLEVFYNLIGQDLKRQYSVSGDVLTFRRCRRQYGMYRLRRYQPAKVIQFYFGTVIHQTLDLAHEHYLGRLDSALKGMVPTNEQIESYFVAAESSLRTRGIVPFSRAARQSALGLLKRFNRYYGPELYPRVQDTECRLQIDLGKFVLQGVVDVLLRSASPKSGLGIWDYKGTDLPTGEKMHRAMQDYELQMRIYSLLYSEKYGNEPEEAVLVFMNELKSDPPTKNEERRAFFRMKVDPEDQEMALKEFTQSVQLIEKERFKDEIRWSPPLLAQVPERHTCDGCDFRWGCDSAITAYRYTPWIPRTT